MKKALRFLGWFISVIVGLVLIAFAIFYGRNIVFLGGTDDECVNYLSKHKKPLTEILNQQVLDSPLFNDAFYKNRMFLLGEVHGFSDVQMIDKFMLFHLNRNLGIRYYVAEMDSTRAGYLNDFLRKDLADTALLKNFVRNLKVRIPQQASHELFLKWMDIHAYNKRLPDSLKLSVIGVDQSFDEPTSSMDRDSSMIVNFEKYVSAHSLQNEKFYGYFGYSHVLQDGMGEKNAFPFAGKIKRSTLPFSKEIQSIICLPIESEMYMPANPQYPSPPDEKTSMFNVDGPFVLVSGINDVKETTEKNSITLFTITNSGSPYLSNQRLAGYKSNLFGADLLPNNEKQVTADLFQHLIFIRGSAALTRMRN